MLLSLLMTAGVLEVVLRFLGPPYYRFNNLSQEYFTNPRGYHDVLRTEGRQTVYGLEYREGDHGYRIPRLDSPPTIESAEKYVLGLGDSFTYGRGVRYGDIYLSRLEKLLNIGEQRVEIRNRAVVGATTEDVVNIYSRESSEIPDESLVIYGFVLNDFGLIMTTPIKGYNFIDFNNEGNTFNPLRKRSALINFVAHRIEERRLHEETLAAYLDSFEGENAVEGFFQMDKLFRSTLENKHVLLVVVFPLLYDLEEYHFESIHEKVRGFCEGKNIFFLDLLPAFSRHKSEELWANPTDHHPNELAHEIAAREIARFIEHELPGFTHNRYPTLSKSSIARNAGSSN